jgi:excisionase family DNA binding protein
MGLFRDIPPGNKAHAQRRKTWERSLGQDTYTVGEAANAMKSSEGKVRKLMKSGELYSEKLGKRGAVIPKEAIIRYMTGPSPWEKIRERVERKRE